MFGGVLDLLQQPAFRIAAVDVTWLEVLADLTGLASVWWAARENVLTWPIGIVNSALFLLLFFDAKLYADSVLQVCFIVLGVYGWWQWQSGGHEARVAGVGTTLPVRRTTGREWAALIAVTVVAQASWTYWLANHTDSPVPFWDASILVLSLVATYGQARKLVESWLVWIAVDIISVRLYLSRELYPTAVVFGIFGGLCVLGLIDWSRTLRTQRALQVAMT